MRIRYKGSGNIGESEWFNTHGLGEVITYGNWGSDSTYIKDLDVEVNGSWVDMNQAFRECLIVPDDLNTYFAPPINDECKLRGYNP